MKNSNIALCTVDSESRAYDIVNDLIANGFHRNDVSVLLPNKLGKTQLAPEAATKAPEGTTVGVTAGGVVGGVLGLLAGVGTLAIPGLGVLVAAGPILATLSGIAAGGAVGGVTGALVGLGMTEMEAKVYEGRLREGHVVVAVDCADDSDRLDDAKRVFKDHDASDVSSIRAKATA